MIESLGTVTMGEMSGGWWEAGRGMREEFGNCLFLVQNHSGRGTLDRGRIERSEMVDRPLSTVELDRRLFYRDERNTIIGEGKNEKRKKKKKILIRFVFFPEGERSASSFCFLVRAKLSKSNNININIIHGSFVSAWFKGGIFYIHVPVFGAYYLFYSWNNVKRCQRWIGPHVHAKGKFTFSSFFSHEIFCALVWQKKRSLFYRQIEKLLEPTVWLDAATQVFYSFGLAFGSLIAFGSYNTPDNHCVRDVILVSCCNAFTAIYASIVIFAILGFKAMTNVDKCLAG